jgi:hypothetical protein
MSDETYYTVLSVKETASPVEIKTAYRDLIKQVHPDTIANLAPFLRKIAEDKAKEITEAYGVLSNSSKRQDYDRQLAAYRRQSASQAPSTPQAPPTSQAPPTHPQQPSRCPICGRSDGGHSAACVNHRTSQASTSSGPHCNKCGSSLFVSGFCPKCNKFATPTATPPQPKAVRWLGYNWAPLKRWAREHPFIVVFATLFTVIFIASFFSDADTSQSSAKTSQSPANPRQGQYSVRDIDQLPNKPTSPSRDGKSPSTNNAAAGSTGLYSKYPCDFRDKVSPIDGKPCEDKGRKATGPQAGARDFSDIDQFVQEQRTSSSNAPNLTIASVSGTYVGTVHNQTVNLSSSFAAVLHQTKSGTLEGCMEVQPPLYGSGALHGSMQGSRVDFVVADITFRGDASTSGIAGSYVVTRQEGNQSGEFHLTRQAGAGSLYHCEGGVLTAVSQTYSDVPTGYKVLPPAANLTVEPPNPLATDSKPPRQPDLSSLTSSEHQSIESACSYAKYNQGPAAYDKCLVRQFEDLRVGPKQPDLSRLTSSERQSIESACSYAKYNQGPAAYNRCQIRHFEEWTTGPKRPDLSSLTPSERQSIESACSYAKYNQGPAAYNQCLVRQLEALTNYRQ